MVPKDFPGKPQSNPFSGAINAKAAQETYDRATTPSLRLKHMDNCGVQAQMLSFAEPSCQAFTPSQLKESIAFAQAANDHMYEKYCKPFPDRFFGLATLPTQDGKAAAEELERVVKKYNFKGCLINGYCNGDTVGEEGYLDDDHMDPLWAKLAELNVPLFLHPKWPVASTFSVGKKYPALL